jgi:DNA repair exonuclease SbcCD ATPase subunit
LDLDNANAEIAGLKDRSDRIDDLQLQLIRITSNYDKASQSLREWNAAFPSKHAHDIVATIKTLETSNRKVTQLADTLRSELSELQKLQANFTQSSQESQATINHLRAQLNEEREMTEHLRKEASLAKNEAESRKRMLDSYEKERTIESGAPISERIVELEKSLQER